MSRRRRSSSDPLPIEFPHDDDDDLREAAEGLLRIGGRIVDTFPWSRWFEAIHERLGEDAPTFGTCDDRSRFPTADAQLVRAQPILDALLDERPFAGPPVDHAQLDVELANAAFADFPPRAL